MARILVVDDSMFQRLTVADILQRLGHETAEAETGNGAIAKLAEEKFDLVCCDLLMPEGSGEDVLEAKKAKGDDTPVIVVSANVQQAVRDRVDNLGARGFLNKPVDEEELVAKVQELLGATTAA